MVHNEYNRIVAESDNAVLFIHGIIGTPNYFNDYIPLIPDDWSVCNILLDGHGKGTSEFAASSMAKWKAQINKKVDELSASHKNVILVAYSMGALLAIEQGIEKSEKIKAMFLITAPLKLFVRPRAVSLILKVLFEKVKPTDCVGLAAQEAFGIEINKNIFEYIRWIPNFAGLYSEIRKTRKIVSKVSVPCFAYQSQKDEFVSPKNRRLLESNPNIKLTMLKNSTHHYFDHDDFVVMSAMLTDYIENNKK